MDGESDRDASQSFLPIVMGLIGDQETAGETAVPPDRSHQIVLVNLATQAMVILHGDPEILAAAIMPARDGAGGASGAPPASKASVEEMKTVEVAAAEECSVCLDRLGDKAEMLVVAKEMPCGHRFHRECIERWLSMHGSCPLCRFQLPAEAAAEVRNRGGRGAVGEEESWRRGVWVTVAVGPRRHEEQE